MDYLQNREETTWIWEILYKEPLCLATSEAVSLWCRAAENNFFYEVRDSFSNWTQIMTLWQYSFSFRSICHVINNLTFLNELWSYCITSSPNYADHKNLIKKSSCLTCPKELFSTQRMQILHPFIFPSIASISQEKNNRAVPAAVSCYLGWGWLRSLLNNLVENWQRICSKINSSRVPRQSLVVFHS